MIRKTVASAAALGGHRRRPHALRAAPFGHAVVALAVVAVLTTGCARVVAGTGAVERPDPNQVAGLTVTGGDSGPRPGVATVPDQFGDLPVANTNGSDVDRLAENA